MCATVEPFAGVRYLPLTPVAA